MGCCNEPVSALAIATPDPAQHVNFAKGMVLGVDDFTQEFAYHAEQRRWLAREASGYGTTSGLRVLAEDAGADGPRLRVSGGAALMPSGKLVCVPADQCALINRWLAKPDSAATVSRLLHVISSPPGSGGSGRISLSLTLCYAECLTRPVPIPGEPCRADDELMAQSRVAEDFVLTLRETPPSQVEEDALRDFVRWLRMNVQFVDGASAPSGSQDEVWLAAMRPAAKPWFDAANASPPPSVERLGDYLFDLSPPNLVVGSGQLCDFLRVAFRFWVTELRPMWMAMSCHRAMQPDLDCVLLAQIAFDVQWIGGAPAGAWQIVGNAASVDIDETRRPVLAHTRLLQEWALCGGAAQGARAPITIANGNITLGAAQYCVICRGAASLNVTLPASTASSAGRIYVVKNVDVTTLNVNANAGAGDRVEGAATLAVKKGAAASVIADGVGQWYVISTTA